MTKSKNLSGAKLALLERHLKGDQVKSSTRSNPTPRAQPGPAPLSFAQQRIYFLQQLDPQNPYYNMPFALRFVGKLDVLAFERGLTEIRRRHAALRTVFREINSEPVQIEEDTPEVILRLFDLSHLPADRMEIASRELATTFASETFDLFHGPLIRAALVRCASDQHLVVVALHHIVGDGSSIAILLDELCTLYQSFLAGQSSPLSDLTIQYADYATWHRRMVEDGCLEKQLAYWKNELGGQLPTLQLPADRARPLRLRYQGGCEPLEIPSDLAIRLVEWSRRQSVTLSMTLLASFYTLLHRYSGQNDVVVGVPASNRNRAEIERSIGLFLNTLAIRMDLSSDPPFEQLLTRVRDRMLTAYANQDVPFERIVDAIQPQRDTSHTPIFQAMFSLRTETSEEPRFPGLRVEEYELDLGKAKCDINLFVEVAPDSIRGSFEYSSEIFDRSTIRNLIQSWRELLEGIVADPNKCISQLPLLSPRQREPILDHDQTEREIPALCLHEMFRRQATKFPDRTAAVFQGKHLSYRALDDRSNQLAHHLRRLGVVPETPVGLCIDRSLELVIGILGILKAGGVYVPLDPAYPQARLDHVLRDSGIAVVIGQSSMSFQVPEGVRVTTVEQSADEPSTAFDVQSDLRQLAYIIYTSGSTGTPKGVAMPHRGLSNLIEWQHSDSAREECVLQFASPSFDVFLQELFATWREGGKLVLVPDEVRRDPTCLREVQRRQAVEKFYVPFAALEQFAAVGLTSGVPSLTDVITAGEQLQVTDAVLEFFEKHDNCRLHNHYGPAETHVVTTHSLSQDVSTWNTLPPIGRPISNARTYVLDRHLQLQPLGVLGELFLSGACLARGYFGSPQLTAERFLPDPFSDQPGARMYRTGDLVRLRQDTGLEFSGRIDQQVKIRGYRIEPGEIETVIKQHASIDEAVVMPHQNHGRQELVAYVTSADSQKPTATELRVFLEDQLPPFMLPAGYVFLDHIPLTPSGKVSRKSISDLQTPERASAENYVAASNSIEETLAAIWAELTGAQRVGIHDNFFMLGGHSLMATQVLARVRQALEIDLPLIALFEHPTVASLADHINQQRQKDDRLARPAIVPNTNRNVFSFLQQRLWFLSQLDPDSVDYSMPVALHIVGPLDVFAIDQSLREILRRHEVLRSRFLSVSGSPQCIVDPVPESVVKVIDLTHLPASEQASQIARCRTHESNNPFDLGARPLYRAQLIRQETNQHILIFNPHHSIFDGESTRVFLDELATLYECYVRQVPSPLKNLTVQYGDFAHWQREWLRGNALEEQMEYWCQQLQGASPLNLPKTSPRRELTRIRGSRHDLCLSVETSNGIQELALREDVTPFMVLLAAFQLVLSRHSGQTDICVGCPVGGREWVELESMIGPFVNTLVLRTDLNGNPTLRELLKRVREVSIGAFAHQHVPFEKLVEALQPERDLTRTPLFQAMFNFTQEDPIPTGFAGLSITALDSQDLASKFDVTLYVTKADGVFDLSLVYDEDLFDSSMMLEMLDQVELILTACVADIDQRTSDVSLVTDRAREILPDPLLKFGEPTDGLPYGRLAQFAESSPEKIAVVDHCGSLTYSELDRRSDEIAGMLSGKSVSQGDVVAVYGLRNAEMVASMLAVLKMGAAFVMLDPEAPQSYLTSRIHQSKSCLVAIPSSDSDSFPEFESPVLTTQTFQGAPAKWQAAHSPGDVAYVAFTSGTSGQPKAVFGSHRPLTHFLKWYERTFSLDSECRFAMLSGIGHDPLLRDIFGPLWLGATLYIPTSRDLRSPKLLATWLLEHEINVIHITPAMVRIIREGFDTLDATFDQLRFAFCGGDVLPASEAEAFHNRTPGARLVNFYGTTETPQAVSWFELPSEDPARMQQISTSVPIGRGIDHAQLLVVNSMNQLAGIGEVGEIQVRTPYLSLGYLDDEQETAKRFLRDHDRASIQIYRTGDRGRYLPDGNVQFAGRRDGQINLRGHRFAPEEAESALLGHDSVRDAAVVLHGEASDVLVALISGMQSVSSLTLRKYLKTRIPEYLIPSRFVWIDKLPRTASGKLNRRELSQLVVDLTRAPSAKSTPVSATEQTLADIWRDALQISNIGRQDNFFDLGGHSLQALVIIDKIEEKLGSKLRPRDLFTDTLGQLASRCDNMVHSSQEDRER